MSSETNVGDRLQIAIPSKGRLQEGAIELLRAAGLRFRVSGRRLFADCSESGTRIIFCNTADIPVLVERGVVDLGITGSDQVQEKRVRVERHRSLGFGRCHLAVAVHKDASYSHVRDLRGKVIGAKFVRLAEDWLKDQGVEDAQVIELQGAVEVMVLLGLVDAIVEIVETGSSLVENDLVELDRVLDAEAILIGHAPARKTELCDRLLRRIDGVLAARRYSLLEYNCPRDSIETASRITPGFSSPTVQPLGDSGWLSVKVMVEKDTVHGVVDALESIGCVAILETDLRSARL